MTLVSVLRASLISASALALSASIACSAGSVGSDEGAGAADGAGAGAGSNDDGTGGEGIVIDPSTQGTGMSNDPRAQNGVPVREKMCDAAGQNCTCLRLALLGTLDSAATNKDTSAFQAWLNGNSDGTATVTMETSKPLIDEAWLAKYDILVIANVNGWIFSEAEKAAVAAWSAGGGGIISLTGFTSTATEAADTSQLIAFSGLSYQGTGSAEYASNNGQGQPVYYQGGSTDLKECLGWTGSQETIITTPIKFTPQTGALEDLTFSLDYVGAFIGWGVTAPEGSTVVATDPMSGRNMAVAQEVGGAGRVLAFGDEWVIFANQWEPIGSPNNMQADEYNKCYIPAESEFHSVRTLYQTKQFWYNAISWVAPPNECNFVVEDNDVIVR